VNNQKILKREEEK